MAFFVVDGAPLAIAEVLVSDTSVSLISGPGEGAGPSNVEPAVGDQTMLLREG
ncbi:MAG: hypothetical protein LBC97_00455 [Bifidobacteriaceae bacterium]|jgi:hypothetical protein|nr:hypothetical protein [Bifidobacteriaceae bacterium]